MSKLYRARSLLYRRQILQENIRWKALDEIYKIYMLLHCSDLNISAKISSNILAFSMLEMLFFAIVSKFVTIFADFNEICSDFESDFLRCSRKCGKTLQLLEIYRFQFDFHHHYTEDFVNFD